MNNKHTIDMQRIIDKQEARIAELESQLAKLSNERDWTEDAALENGNYQNQCANCDLLFIGHKRRAACKMCAAPQVKETAIPLTNGDGHVKPSSESARPDYESESYRQGWMDGMKEATELCDAPEASSDKAVVRDVDVIRGMRLAGFYYMHVLNGKHKHFVGDIKDARALLQSAAPAMQITSEKWKFVSDTVMKKVGANWPESKFTDAHQIFKAGDVLYPHPQRGEATAAPAQTVAQEAQPVGWIDNKELERARQSGGSVNLWLDCYRDTNTPLYATPTASKDAQLFVDEVRPDHMTDTDVARIYRRVYGGPRYDILRREFAAEIAAFRDNQWAEAIKSAMQEGGGK